MADALRCNSYCLEKTPTVWFVTHEKHEEASNLLRSLLCDTAANLPPNAIETAMDWSLGHVDNAHWLHIVQAIIRRAAPDKRKEFGDICLARSFPEDRGVILLAMVRYSGDSESIELASDWLKESWVDAQDSLVASMVEALLTKSSNPDLLVLAKSLLPKANSENACLLLTGLLDAGDVDAVRLAKQWLDTRRIEKRSRGIHINKGRLLKSLLATTPKDREVLEKTRKWLTTEVDSSEKELQACIQHAYDNTSH